MDPGSFNQALSMALKSCYDNATALFNASNIDIMNQTFPLLDADGDIISSDTTAIDFLQTTSVTSSAIFGAQFGATLAIAIVLLLMTTVDKYKTLPFIFNMLALICDIIRCVLQIIQLNGPLSNFTVVTVGWYSGSAVAHAIPVAVAGSVFTFLLFVFIELALITQVRVVCAATSRLQRTIVTWSTIAIGILAVGFRLNLTILNIISTTHLPIGDGSSESQEQVTKAQTMSGVSAIVSICIFSAIFCFKLYKAIMSRSSMGLTRFGTMHIIFIMGCQTLVLPAIFAIVAYFKFRNSQIQSAVETIVAIFLPLSSIWASANTNARLRETRHVALTALPEYRPQPGYGTTGNSTTLVDTTRDSGDGLRADERQYRSKYDVDSSVSVDQVGGEARDIELQSLGVRRVTSLGRIL